MLLSTAQTTHTQNTTTQNKNNKHSTLTHQPPRASASAIRTLATSASTSLGVPPCVALALAALAAAEHRCDCRAVWMVATTSRLSSTTLRLRVTTCETASQPSSPALPLRSRLRASWRRVAQRMAVGMSTRWKTAATSYGARSMRSTRQARSVTPRRPMRPPWRPSEVWPTRGKCLETAVSA